MPEAVWIGGAVGAKAQGPPCTGGTGQPEARWLLLVAGPSESVQGRAGGARPVGCRKVVPTWATGLNPCLPDWEGPQRLLRDTLA